MFRARACIVLMITCAVKTGSIGWNAGHERFRISSLSILIAKHSFYSFYFGFEHSHEFLFGGDFFCKNPMSLRCNKFRK